MELYIVGGQFIYPCPETKDCCVVLVPKGQQVNPDTDGYFLHLSNEEAAKVAEWYQKRECTRVD